MISMEDEDQKTEAETETEGKGMHIITKSLTKSYLEARIDLIHLNLI